MAILEVHHIEKHFGATRVLEDISFDLEQGQALAIIGSSGSGKTTLLRCLNFLEKPEQGTISVAGNLIFDAADPATQRESEVRKKRLHFGLVFQSFNLFPQYTALKNVTLARELLAQELRRLCDGGLADLILTTGGTGFSPTDQTPEATMDVVERLIFLEQDEVEKNKGIRIERFLKELDL